MDAGLEGINIASRADEFAVWLLKAVDSDNKYGVKYVFAYVPYGKDTEAVEELREERLKEVLNLLSAKFDLEKESAPIYNIKVHSFDKEKLKQVLDKIELRRITRNGEQKTQTPREPAKVTA